MSAHQLPPGDPQLQRMHDSARAMSLLSKIHLVLLCVQLLPVLIAMLGVAALVVVVGWLLLFG